MATFTLREIPGTGLDVPDPNAIPANQPGATLLVVDRLLEDTHGHLRGSFTFRGIVTKKFTDDDLEVAFDATNRLRKGLINTQGVIRFRDFASANGVTWAIVGGTRRYRKAHGTVTGKSINSVTYFTFRIR